MPIQTPQWTDFLICPICCIEYNQVHNPVSLACGHSFCKCCLSKLQRKQCPFDQTVITMDLINLPTNFALLQLAPSGLVKDSDKHETNLNIKKIAKLSDEDFMLYCDSVRFVENISLYLKPFTLGVSSPGSVSVLSRPMQRKLVMLINCQLLEEEGRTRALKAARSLGERTVTELIIQHQNPQQLSTNLWAAVRARGCQFLGPAMQEEVLKLVLLALEDGSALSRKVLVMFVVQRLEPHFPQASKTSIGHVVQLLYRASCFVVSKREGDSSLMKLKEEFRTYDALRREHDAQIVEIATEAGLRIAPDQWSALLYGDTAHKSHIQSIIDKLQNPQSFAQSVQELMIALQRNGDLGNLCTLRPHLEYLADININQDPSIQSWLLMSKTLEAALTVVSGLVNFIKIHGCRKTNVDVSNNIAAHASKYKVSLCRDFTVNRVCPRGVNCTFAHSDEELVKYRSKNRKYIRKDPDNGIFSKFPILNSCSSPAVRTNSDPLLDECCRSVHNNFPLENSPFTFCKSHDCALPDFNEISQRSHNGFVYSTRFLGTHPTSSSAGLRVRSPQYLVAMNHRKQQIISELQQVLSDVQSQQLEDHGHTSTILSARSFWNSDYYLNSLLPKENYMIGENYPSSTELSLISGPPLDRTFCEFGSPPAAADWTQITFPNPDLAETLHAPKFLNNSTALYGASDGWNTGFSPGLCLNCYEDKFVDASQQELSTEEHESLLLKSAKLQDQLRGLKKQITDIKDKTYEEGIINDLRALEIRLECELAEEEKKLWPMNSSSEQ